MSGGSYEYLCYKEANQFLDEAVQDNLQLMAERLAELGYARDAALETESLLLIVRQVEVRLQARIDRLRDIWQSVEWWDSCDWGEDEVKRALEKYRKEGVP